MNIDSIKSEAVTLNIDGKARNISQNMGKFDGTANWCYDNDKFHIQSTSGAGTNSARIYVNGTLVFHASNFGKFIDSFRKGSWLDDLESLNKQASVKKAEKESQRNESDKRELESKFEPVLF